MSAKIELCIEQVLAIAAQDLVVAHKNQKVDDTYWGMAIAGYFAALRFATAVGLSVTDWPDFCEWERLILAFN